MTDKPDPIMILTTMPVFNYISFDLFEFYPNPNTEQLLAITGPTVRLAFAGEEDGISVLFRSEDMDIYTQTSPDCHY